MSLVSKKILGIPITVSPKKNILEYLSKYLTNAQCTMHNGQIMENPLVIFTPNPEIIEYAQTDPEFKKIMNIACINLPDGEGVVWAIRHIYKEKITRISGVDFMSDLCNLADRETIRIGLIGGKNGVALSTAKCLHKMYPGLKIEVFEAGEIAMSNAQCSNQILEKTIKSVKKWIEEGEIGILFVALGFPKQEYFIEMLNEERTMHNAQCTMLKKKMKPLVLMAVGGSFDYISGKIGRAPTWVRENRLEWLYRLMREPSRMTRQLKGVNFFLRILKRNQ